MRLVRYAFPGGNAWFDATLAKVAGLVVPRGLFARADAVIEERQTSGTDRPIRRAAAIESACWGTSARVHPSLGTSKTAELRPSPTKFAVMHNPARAISNERQL